MHLERISRYRRRWSHSRSRSPHRHRSHEDYSHSRCGSHRSHDEREHYHGSRRRHRSMSPGNRRGRSRSPGGRHKRSPVRESSEERRAKIAQWNKEREEQEGEYGYSFTLDDWWCSGSELSHGIL